MRRLTKILIALGAVSFAVSSFAADTSASSSVAPAEREKIESVVHDYLMKNPEVIVQAIQAMQQKQYQEAEQSVKKTQAIANNFAEALFRHDGDPVAGNPKGEVTVTEFFDYQCPHCVDMAPIVSEIIKANPNVRFVFKEFPIRGPMSETAARAALAANMQGKYYQFSHAVLTNTGDLNQDTLMKIARNVGLNVDKLKKDMNSDTVKQQLQANMKLGQDLKLFGTPALFVGKTNGNDINYFPGAASGQQLQSLIDKAK